MREERMFLYLAQNKSLVKVALELNRFALFIFEINQTDEDPYAKIQPISFIPFAELRDITIKSFKAGKGSFESQNGNRQFPSDKNDCIHTMNLNFLTTYQQSMSLVKNFNFKNIQELDRDSEETNTSIFKGINLVSKNDQNQSENGDSQLVFAHANKKIIHNWMNVCSLGIKKNIIGQQCQEH